MLKNWLKFFGITNESVNFVIPDYAMSAGTLFAFSGDKIYMDYSSSLGPIDPKFIMELILSRLWGYLGQVGKTIRKSAEGKLPEVDVLIIKGQDLALLNKYK